MKIKLCNEKRETLLEGSLVIVLTTGRKERQTERKKEEINLKSKRKTVLPCRKCF